MDTIDITKKYETRDGRAVTGLRRNQEPDTEDYWFDGTIEGRAYEDCWTRDGRFYVDNYDHVYDLVLADDQEPEKLVPGLLTPDPLKVEYGIFVAAVKANFAAGTFATATQEQFDSWLESLTPILRA